MTNEIELRTSPFSFKILHSSAYKQSKHIMCKITLRQWAHYNFLSEKANYVLQEAMESFAFPNKIDGIDEYFLAP